MSARFALGVSRPLLHVPVPLAAAHQAGAVTVLAAALFAAHELRRRDRSYFA
jgi:heme a synthase